MEEPNPASTATTEPVPPSVPPAKVQLVWAKQRGQPWWPAEVVTDFSAVRQDVMKFKHPPHYILVWYFGGEARSYGWVDPGPSQCLPWRSEGFKTREKVPASYRTEFPDALAQILAMEAAQGGPTLEELARSEGSTPKAPAKKRQREDEDAAAASPDSEPESEAKAGVNNAERVEKLKEAREAREARAKKREEEEKKRGESGAADDASGADKNMRDEGSSGEGEETAMKRKKETRHVGYRPEKEKKKNSKVFRALRSAISSLKKLAIIKALL